MPQAKYLIAGSSHAAIEAAAAIRMLDSEGSMAMLTRDRHLPYSPTVLPYIVSGQSDPAHVVLRDDAYFARHKIEFVPGAAITGIDTGERVARVESGDEWQYEKLLLATGAAPAIPPISGLAGVPYHVLRTMDDALGLRAGAKQARSAVVLGGGLIGMHAAENLARAGLEVTVVEMQPQVLPAYFDAAAAAIIEASFNDNGARMLLGRTVVGAARRDDGCAVTLDDGDEIGADMLLVATGVKPATGYLNGSGIDTDRGILVDDAMATSAANVWAAGDVAQARDFHAEEKTVGGILPAAVEQGRIAGMAMIDDPGLKPYPGGVPLNTYTFFGQQAISVGAGTTGREEDGFEITRRSDPDRAYYLRIALRDDRLWGIVGINAALDPGIMWQLILRRTDLGPVKDEFLARPLETGRALMSRTWR